MSTTLKISFLKTLRLFGKRSLMAKSPLGLPYRISIGDMFSENPYYNSSANIGEILSCAAWADRLDTPVIYDIGAHGGYIATQLSQLLSNRKPTIWAFEPIPPTYADLVSAVYETSQRDHIYPLPLALGERSGVLRINYSKWTSMLAQVVPPGSVSNNRSGTEIFQVPSMSLDDLMDDLPFPNLMKIDVEGWEVPVFRGGKRIFGISSGISPAVCFEWNPGAHHQTGFRITALVELMPGYRFFYINDYSGQRMPELSEVSNLHEIDWECNLFAIRSDQERISLWKSDFLKLKQRYKIF